MSDRPDPTRVVADVDVLVADLFVDGDARAALDLVRSHSWLTLIVTDRLLDETAAVITSLADDRLATDWRATTAADATVVEPTRTGHPALEAAAAGQASTILSHDERFQRAATGAAIRPHLATSVKSPGAFRHLVRPASLYDVVADGSYPGPDRDPRA